MVTHPNWGVMIVGAVCCDKLTESTIGSDGHAEFLNYINRRKAFIDSPKWIATPNGVCTIKRAGIVIEIVPTHDGTFRFNLDDVKGKIGHATLLDAKFSVFDYVDSGKAAGYLAERRRKIAERTAAKGCVIVDT